MIFTSSGLGCLGRPLLPPLWWNIQELCKKFAYVLPPLSQYSGLYANKRMVVVCTFMCAIARSIYSTTQFALFPCIFQTSLVSIFHEEEAIQYMLEAQRKFFNSKNNTTNLCKRKNRFHVLVKFFSLFYSEKIAR